MYSIVQTIENEQVVFLIKCLPSNRYSKRIIPRKTKKNVDKTLTFGRIWLEFFGFGPFSKRYLDDFQLSCKSYLCLIASNYSFHGGRIVFCFRNEIFYKRLPMVSLNRSEIFWKEQVATRLMPKISTTMC